MNVFRDQNPQDALRFEADKVGRDYKVSRNFELRELASKDRANLVLLHPALILGLQTIRDHVGKPIRVSSGYRSPEHSIERRKANPGTHSQGIAADIRVKPEDRYRFIKLAYELGFTGIGVSNRFVHLDISKTRSAIWSY